MSNQEDVDDFLEHHGVKGMHWGQRRAARATRDQSIRDARTRNASRELLANQQVAKYNTSTSVKGKAAADTAIKKMTDEAENSGDNKLAAQRTSGEKATKAVLITVGTVLAARVVLNAAAAAAR